MFPQNWSIIDAAVVTVVVGLLTMLTVAGGKRVKRKCAEMADQARSDVIFVENATDETIGGGDIMVYTTTAEGDQRSHMDSSLRIVPGRGELRIVSDDQDESALAHGLTYQVKLLCIGVRWADAPAGQEDTNARTITVVPGQTYRLVAAKNPKLEEKQAMQLYGLLRVELEVGLNASSNACLLLAGLMITSVVHSTTRSCRGLAVVASPRWIPKATPQQTLFLLRIVYVHFQVGTEWDKIWPNIAAKGSYGALLVSKCHA